MMQWRMATQRVRLARVSNLQMMIYIHELGENT